MVAYELIHEGAVARICLETSNVMIRFSALLPISVRLRMCFVNKRPHSNIIILVYGYLSTEVHLPLIPHKRTAMPQYVQKQWSLSKFLTLTEHNEHSPCICYCYSFCYCPFCFQHSVVSQKKK